ncbi:carbamoyl-phosphate synthase large subunit [Pseudoclavibacter chungangensis]|uniref:Carbamoyl-phosphate synthase large subunit n=1 Tax=Pseudoclavibacter chungangensis TaxID=587635 RepID=A0A7J5BNR0_9MICO|nr:carbamoyl-phosphate synthase large subunit [Pseudoclavibacter chungangensis]KAB1654037.1 carbamoyl-phosphate synthase large subunit [Pseudoclavibacter chungangensis]NYJ66056.1 hypothetical protein [Pseudoclavibacter chungangensis]
MRVLVTSSRNPFALDIVRKLATTGSTVVASDTFDGAVGSHSKYLLAHEVTASPTFDTDAFTADVVRIVEHYELDTIIPTFEEAFYLSARRADLPSHVRLYTGEFTQLAHLHDKNSFQRIAKAADVPVPETIIATDDASLRAATERYPHWFARAAFSRGGVALLTNTGPIAAQSDIADVHPTREQPWLVQPFVSGPMVCTYSTVIDGRVTSHATYRAIEQWENSTAVGFESIDSTVTFEYVQRIVGQLGNYSGQLSFDFVDHDGGLLGIECNPRTTNGVTLMTAEHFATAVSTPGSGPFVVEPGVRTEISAAVLAEAFAQPLRHMPTSVRELLTVPDLGKGWHDGGAMLWAPAALVHGLRLGRGQHEKALAALGEDIVWDGGPIEGTTPEQQRMLAELHAEGE